MAISKQEIAEKFLFYRKKQNLTQKEIAELLGVRTVTVSGWERCVSSINVETLSKVCEIFGITPNEMFGIDNNEVNPDTLTYSERILIQTYRNSPDVQPILDKLLDLPADKDNYTAKFAEYSLNSKMRSLDFYGQETVKAVINLEYERCQASKSNEKANEKAKEKQPTIDK